MGPSCGFSRLRRLARLLLLSSYPLVVVSYKYAKICQLQSPLVSLEFDPVSGLFSTTPSEDIDARMLVQNQRTPGHAREKIVRVGTAYGRKRFLRGENSYRLLDSDPSNLFDDASAVSTVRKRNFMARSCPCDTSGRTYCLIDSVSMAAADSCGIPWSDNISIILQTSNNISESVMYNTLGIGCFKLSSQAVFTRNAVSIAKKTTKHFNNFSTLLTVTTNQWPVVVLWYGALFIFLIFTSNGKFARSYIGNLVCPRLRINEAHVERILARENEIRRRLRVAAMRTANFPTPERLSYLMRTQVPISSTWRRSGMTEEETRQEAARWWIAQVENLGILRRVNAPEQMEYVLKTRQFNKDRERARRNQTNRLKVESMADCIEDGINDSSLSSTPKKNATSREEGEPSTPETVTTTSSGSDDDQPNLADPSDAIQIERVSSAEVSQNECAVCPEDSFECTICLTEIEDGELVGVLPCTHVYHADCLRQWISRKNACPLCQVTEIASPRPVGGGGGNPFPSEDDTAPSEERYAPRNEEADQYNTSHNPTNWFARTFMLPLANTPTYVETELRSYQNRRRRRHRSDREAERIHLW
jgi:hypothetical protein